MKSVDYAYVSGTTKTAGTCKYDSKKGIAKASAVSDIKPYNSSAIKAVLVQSPLAIAVKANQNSFIYYKTGILNSDNCIGTSTTIDHSVTVVGYGYTNSTYYYLVKNSWGTAWGEKGYVRLRIEEKNGTCGMNTYPSWTSVV
jgi:C1A family cysteine protease